MGVSSCSLANGEPRSGGVEKGSNKEKSRKMGKKVTGTRPVRKGRLDSGRGVKKGVKHETRWGGGEGYRMRG